MSKLPARKVKPPPWIPPGKTTQKIKNVKKPQQSENHKKDVNVSPKQVVNISQNENDNPNDELHESLSSTSSYGGHNEPNIHLFSVYQEMKLLYMHFASLKTSYLSAHRLVDLQNFDDVSTKDKLNEIGDNIKEMNDLFDNLEFAVSLLENTLDEGHQTQEYSKVFIHKEKLLSMLLEAYEKLIIIFQTVFGKQDFKEMSLLQDSLSRKLLLAEKKNISQEAVIRDLERKISIYQSKTNAIESYKTKIESAKTDLEKQLMHKETQIKYLSDELLNVSSKQMKSDHDEMIEILESVKAKAQSDKSALKKAIKLQRLQLKENEEKFQKLIQESNEKEKMMFNIASQRDQLKVQLTVVNNNVIQLNNQIEEMKIQNLKYQNEIAEKDLAKKKEINELQSALDEKLQLLEKALKEKKQMEISIQDLEKELEASTKKIESLKEEIRNVKVTDFPKTKDTDVVYEEMHHLSSLLQSTRETFENLKESSHVMSAGGNYSANAMNWNNIQDEILSAVKETKKHLLELKNWYKIFLQEQKENHSLPRKSDLEKQLKKLEYLYSTSMKENQALKSEIKEIKSGSASSATMQKTENHFTTSMPSDNFARKLQFELLKKNEEILKMKHEFQHTEKNLENQLREYKDRVKSLEIDREKMSNLEEELAANKLQLFDLQRKKEEETERLLQRAKELQNSLDLKNAEYESLQRFVQLLKSSYFNVFEGS